MSKSGYEFAKAVFAKNKAIISAAKNQNKKEVAKIVRTPARSYKKSNNRSKSRGISGSSSSNSSKTDSGNVNQGVTTQNQGSNAPPGFQAPPPPTNTVYDYVSRDNNTNISDSTLKKIEDAPYSPIENKNDGEKNTNYYNVNQKKDKDKVSNTIITNEEYYEITDAKSELEQTGREQISWQPPSNDGYYTIEDKDFNPEYLHGPGATKENAVDQFSNMPGWQLTSKQMDIYLENLGKRNLEVAESIDVGDDIVDFAKKNVVFTVDGKDKTWDEIKKDEPALELNKTNEGVEYDLNYTNWYNKQDDFTKNLGRFFGGFANWDYIVETVGRGDFEKGTDIVAQWTYEQTKRIKDNDWFGAGINIPAMQNIVLPYLGGVAIGGVTKAGSTAATWVGNKGFTATEKTLRYGGRSLIAGGTVVMGGTVAFDVAQTENDKKISKLLTYGTQFSFFGAGAKAVNNIDFTPKTKISITKEGNLAFQKFRTIGNKNLWKVGEPQVFGRTSSGGIARVVSPFASSSNVDVNWMSASQFNKLKFNPSNPFRGGGTKSIVPRTDPAVVALYNKPSSVSFDFPKYTIYPTIVSPTEWNNMRIKDFKDMFKNINDPNFTVKLDTVTMKEWEPMREKYKDVFKDIQDPDYKVNAEIIPESDWNKIKPKSNDVTPFKDADVPVKPDIVTTKEWDVYRLKYKDLFKKVDDSNLPVKVIKDWQPRTGRYMDLDNPIVQYKSKLLTEYKFPGKPVLYGKYNMPYQSIFDFPTVLESGSFANFNEGMVKLKPNKIIKDFSKDFRKIEKKLDSKGKSQGQSGGQGQESVTLTKQKQESVNVKISEQKVKVDVKLEIPEILKRSFDTDVKVEYLQKKKTKSIWHPEYQYEAIGSKSITKPKNKMMFGVRYKQEQKIGLAQKNKIDVLLQKKQALNLLPLKIQSFDTVTDKITNTDTDAFLEMTSDLVFDAEKPFIDKTVIPKFKIDIFPKPKKPKDEELKIIKSRFGIPKDDFIVEKEKKFLIDVDMNKMGRFRAVKIPDPFKNKKLPGGIF